MAGNLEMDVAKSMFVLAKSIVVPARPVEI